MWAILPDSRGIVTGEADEALFAVDE